jgi:hypothetical protein
VLRLSPRRGVLCSGAPGLPSHAALPIHAATHAHGLGICIWEGESVDALRGVVEGLWDHGRTTGTTRPKPSVSSV